MNKLQQTIWVSVEIPGVNEKGIYVEKGSFYYNNKKYLIEKGEIKGANND